MTTDLPQNDVEAFYAFLVRRLEQGSNVPPKRVCTSFVRIRKNIRRLRSKLATSHQEFVDSEAKELDTDALMERVRARLAQQEIRD